MSEANASARGALFYIMKISPFVGGVAAVATNYRAVARKLQQAIAIRQNRRISINQYQAYSVKAGRTVTKYVLSEYQQTKDGKGKYKTIFEAWNVPSVVKFLADELQKGGAKHD